MKREDLRKVEVKKKNGEIVQGYFHQWVVATNGKDGDIKAGIAAIVELEDGNVMVVGGKNIKFIKPDMIDEII